MESKVVSFTGLEVATDKLVHNRVLKHTIPNDWYIVSIPYPPDRELTSEILSSLEGRMIILDDVIAFENEVDSVMFVLKGFPEKITCL